ncbi:RNase H domain protein [Mycena polygramma]|nr:RNase H domain protein [Mycena polygramma]
MFPVRLVNSTDNGAHRERFAIRRRFVPAVSDLKTMMVYTDGACAANGQAAPRGGYAFVFNGTSEGTVSGALENTGPDRQVHIHTNNRAELRAVIAALKFRTWWGESWNRVVIVTDSEYVAKGATTWMRNWAANGWRKAGSKRERVVNRDLWEALSELMGAYAAGGCEVSFWVVPRAWNALADAAAKAASQLDGVAKYENTLGFLC